MSETGPQVQVFKFSAPDNPGNRHITRLAKTDRMFSQIQVLNEGGERAAHSHTHLDGFWFVLKGRVRFYGDKDQIVAELGPMEGILIPRGFQYWFESVGTETVNLLQVENSDVVLGPPRFDAVFRT